MTGAIPPNGNLNQREDSEVISEPMANQRGADATLLLHEAPTRIRPPDAEPSESLASVRRELLRCALCQAVAAGMPPVHPQHDMIFYCDSCRAQIAGAPRLPPEYQLLRELGRGGVGVVYLARHRRLGVDRAIKMLLPHAVLSRRNQALFLREATAQAPLTHRNIVQIHDLVEIRPAIFCIVMEYVDGHSVSEAIRRATAGRLAVEVAVPLMVQTLAALAHAHEKGYIHRDVKDGNVLLSRGENGLALAKLTDFGLAKSYQGGASGGLTGPDDLGGTLGYLAPEQILNFREARPPADLYAAGVTLYRMLTGELPIEPRQGRGAVLHLLESTPRPIRDINPAIPPALAAVIDQALDKRPERRPPSARRMSQMLMEAVCLDPQAPPPAVPWNSVA